MHETYSTWFFHFRCSFNIIPRKMNSVTCSLIVLIRIICSILSERHLDIAAANPLSHCCLITVFSLERFLSFLELMNSPGYSQIKKIQNWEKPTQVWHEGQLFKYKIDYKIYRYLSCTSKLCVDHQEFVKYNTIASISKLGVMRFHMMCDYGFNFSVICD